MKWKFECPLGVAYFPVSTLKNEMSTISMDKKLGQGKYVECNSEEIIVKFCSILSCLLHNIYSGGGAWYS